MMINTPFRRHKAQVEARLMSETASAGSGPAPAPKNGPLASAYELLLIQLADHKRKLKDIQSREHKIAFKQQIIGTYDPHVEGWLAAIDGGGRAVQDEVVTTIMVWSIDIADYDRGLLLAKAIIDHDVQLPQHFNRTAPCFVAEQVAEDALKHLGTGGDNIFDTQVLRETEAITQRADMVDEARAKLFKALGLAEIRDAETLETDSDGPAGGKRALQQQALDHLKRALQLDHGVGVKKDVERLSRILGKADTEIEQDTAVAHAPA